MGTYQDLTAAGITTRASAALTGVARAAAARAKRPVTAGPDRDAVVPANRLTQAERARLLAVLNSAEFVDQPPLQVYATLLERGTYLRSDSTMYRILAEHDQVKERRRLARHPARAVPELVATAPGQVYSPTRSPSGRSARSPIARTSSTTAPGQRSSVATPGACSVCDLAEQPRSSGDGRAARVTGRWATLRQASAPGCLVPQSHGTRDAAVFRRQEAVQVSEL